jgi:hypothetical protein
MPSQALDDLGSEAAVIPIRKDQQAVVHHLNTIAGLIDAHLAGVGDLRNRIRISAGNSRFHSPLGFSVVHHDRVAFSPAPDQATIPESE